MAKKQLTIEELLSKLDAAKSNLEAAQSNYDSAQVELQKASEEYNSEHKAELSLSAKLNALQTKKSQLEPIVAETAAKVKQGIDKDYGVFKAQIAKLKAELNSEKDDSGKTGKLPSDYIKTSIENVANEILWWFPDFGSLNEEETQLDEVNKVIDETSKELSGLDVESKESALVEAKQAAAEAKKKLTAAKSLYSKAKNSYETALGESGPGQKDAVKVNNETVSAQLDEVYAPFFNAGLDSSYLSWNKLVPELKKGTAPEAGSKEELYYKLIKEHSQDIVNKAFDVLGASGILTVHGNEIWVDAAKLAQYNGNKALMDILKAVNIVKAYKIPNLKVPKAILPVPQDFGGSNLPGNPGYMLGQPLPPELIVETDFENRLNKAEKNNINRAFNMIKASRISNEMPDGFLVDEDGTEFAPVSSMDADDVYQQLLPAFQTTCAFRLNRSTRRRQDKCMKEGGLPRYTANYTEFNEWLRNIKKPIGYTISDFQQYVKQCDEEMKQCVIPIDMVVQRGMRAVKYYYDLNPGDVFVDQGIMSTSMTDHGAFGGDIKLYIRIRKGSHASFACGYSAFPSETEIILPRGSKFKVLHKKTSSYGASLTLWCELLQ